MHSTMMTGVRQSGLVSKTFNNLTCAVVIGLAGFALAVSPASALVTGGNNSLRQQLKENSAIIDVYVARRGYVARGPRGGVVAGRTTVVRPGYRPGYAGWARPGWYRWAPGGAIAAGAAIGFVAAATAASWAGAPPAPGYCWYYTDPSRTQGFWDACP
jgi:hypothetical protein